MELKQAFEFPLDLEWLNSEPQNLVELRGRVVVLLFWIADSYNKKIRTFAVNNNVLTDSKIKTDFLNPCAVTIDDESLWIADSGANSIYRYYFASDYLSRITIQPF